MDEAVKRSGGEECGFAGVLEARGKEKYRGSVAAFVARHCGLFSSVREEREATGGVGFGRTGRGSVVGLTTGKTVLSRKMEWRRGVCGGLGDVSTMEIEESRCRGVAAAQGGE
ncbi:hypothetical protein HAX54_016229 [Datura stramonium]|uniref:Uncharacterized protein n=1 Tax=Datura stramonium TaxID=4076 RepID=A0ABS8UKS7_DATST|nr:hypothetical protein [Datura stramonium]